MSRARMWEAFKSTVLPSPDGPIVAERGDIVVVLVVPSWSAAFARLSQIVKSETKDAKP